MKKIVLAKRMKIHFRSLLSSSLIFLLPSIVAAQQWQILANENQIASLASNYTHITTVADGAITIPYVVYTEAGIAKVKKYDGENWVAVDGNVSTGNATYTRIYADDNGKLYVTYVDPSNGNRLAVKTYNESTQVWEPLNGDATNLYVSAGSVTNSISQYNSTPRSALAFDSDNTPYIIYGDSPGLTPFVKRFNGTAWETVGTGAISAQRAIGVGIAIDNDNTPYIVYINQATATSTTGNMVVYRYLNNNWEPIAVPSPVPGGSSTTGATTAIRHTAISFNGDWNPVISYFNANNSNRATAIVYNKATGAWNLSAVISSRDITNNGLTRDQAGNLYASFTDVVTNGSGRSLARVMKLAAGTTTWTEVKNADVTQGIDEPAGSLSLTLGSDNRPYIVYTKTNSSSVVTPIVQVFANVAPPPPPPPPPADEVVTTPKQVEKLGRGLVAVRTGSEDVYIGWRLFGTDPESIGFNVYRDGVKLNTTPITNSTNYIDHTATDGIYTVRAVINGSEQETSRAASVWAQNYLNIPLQRPAGGVTPAGEAYTYSPNDCSVGDLDGDGEYEIILKWDPSNAKDNSQAGYTGNVYLDAYKLDGTRLWRIDLGRNIRDGAHYTQFMVYDLDGDGKAEMACKTADGTVDGTGVTIGDPLADYRNSSGYVLSGPEFLTIFNGLTGAAMATTNYLPARGSVSSWGDNYGNRVDRFIAAIAYLDGAHPSLIMGRGYYTRLVRVAWDWRNGQLTHRWTFDSNTPGNQFYAGQGNHQMTVGDVDGDGKDEIFNGSSAINDNGNGLWANGMGHGDALHMTDMDPDRPGKEMWQPYEYPPGNGRVGAALVDAKTGERIFTVSEATADVGRGLSADIDPRYKGNEVWAARGGLYTSKGVQIGTVKPSMNFATWWDGDLTRELLDGTTISKWNYNNNTLSPLLSASGTLSNNGTKATPGLSADLFGDWREEVIFRTSDNSNLRIYTTTIPTEHRIYTLMHDPQYRVAIAWQNSAYNQPPHPSFYLGEGMDSLPTPNLEYVQDIIPPIALAKNVTVTLNGGMATVLPQDVDNGSYDAFGIGKLELSDSTFTCSDIGANTVILIVTDVNGNVSTANATITVIGSMPATPVITVSRADTTYTGANEKTIFLGYGAQELILSADNSESTIAYSWNPSTYLSSNNIANPVFAPTEAGAYTFTTTAANQFGCTASASVTIDVVDVRCGQKMDRVRMCHKGRTICVARASVPPLLAHGSTIGTCNAITINHPGKNREMEMAAAAGLTAYPNPVNSKTTISFSLVKPGKYSLSIYDMKGSLIKVLSRGEAQGSKNLSYELNAVEYAGGLYFIRLVTETEVVMKRILIQR